MLTSLYSEARPTLKLAFPLIIAFLGQQFITITDTFVSGQLGVESLAAVSLGGALFWMVTIFPIGLLMGLDPIISQALGAGRHAEAWRACQRGVTLGLCVAIPTAILLGVSAVEGWPWSPEGAVGSQLWSYLMGRMWCVPLALVHLCLRSFLQAHERGGVILGATGLSFALNLFLSVYLSGGDLLAYQVFGWAPSLSAPFSGLGVFGIGLASSIVSLVEVALLAVIAQRGERRRALTEAVRDDAVEVEVTEARLASHLASWRALWRVGAPIGGAMLSEGGVFCLSTLIVSAWSVSTIGAHQIVLQLCSTSFMICLGISSATCVRVGLAWGAGEQQRARAAAMIGLILSVIVMSVSALIFITRGEALAGLLTDDPSVIALCAELLVIVILFQIFDGVQVTLAAALRGAGFTKIPLVSALVSHWMIGLPLGLYLAFWAGLEVVGLWWGLSGGLISASLILTTAFFWLTRGHATSVVRT